LPDKLLLDIDGEHCNLCNHEKRTVWQIPEYFISIKNSSSRISSRMIGVSLKGAFGSSTTNASVSIFVVAVMVLVIDERARRLSLRAGESYTLE